MFSYVQQNGNGVKRVVIQLNQPITATDLNEHVKWNPPLYCRTDERVTELFSVGYISSVEHGYSGRHSCNNRSEYNKWRTR